MTARKKLFAGAAVLALLAGGGAWAMYCCRTPDPIYEGKPLSYWLAGEGSGDTLMQGKEINEAVRHMGTNAIPLLLKYMSARDSTAKVKLTELAAEQHIINFSPKDDTSLHIQAFRGFQALGEDASGAVPELIRIYQVNSSPDAQLAVIASLGFIGPRAKEAIPLVMRAATNSDATFRSFAIQALGRMRIDPETIVPLLTTALSDPSPWIRLEAVRSLSNFGPEAKPAMLPLLELRQSLPDTQANKQNSGAYSLLRKEINEALQKIDPAAAAKAVIQATNVTGAP